ncbi:MAG: hypothetical protein L3K16_03345 [Thermoplasmata archaeon]|nr:hypothetical protein [Thermoplasmata archaeon]
MAGATGDAARPTGILPPLPPLDPNPTTRVPGGIVWVRRQAVGSIYLFAAVVGACVLPLTNLVVAATVAVGGDIGHALQTPPLPWIWVVVGSIAFLIAGGVTSAAFDVRKIGIEPAGVHFSSTLETQFVPWTAFRRPIVDQGRLGATIIYVREGRASPRTTWLHLPHDQAAVLASHPTFSSWPFVSGSGRGPAFEKVEGRYHT